MQRDYETRAVCVWAGAYGSGYLIAPSLVLTAGHVAKGLTGRILFIEEDQWWDCRRIWRRDDSDVDAALLEISDPEWRPPVDLTPIRWGRLTGSRAGVEWEAVGFPDAQPLVGGHRDTEHLAGTINPGTRRRGHRCAARIAGMPPEASAVSPWAGLSGAALFCGELLTGLVTEDPAGWASGRVEAVPVSLLAAESRFSAAVKQHTGQPLLVESVELSGLFKPPTATQPARSPVSLLRVEAATVNFRGRKALLDDLARWCRGGGMPVRLMVGPGGQGKTRLSREFAARMQARGWITGWLAEASAADTAASPLIAETREPLLLIVEYAETRSEQLCSLLRPLLDRPVAGTVRILLLARSTGQWWEELQRDTPGLRELASNAVIELPPLEDELQGRLEAFAEAIRDFANGLAEVADIPQVGWTRIAGTIEPPQDLAHQRYEPVLGIHMAALAALLQAGSAPAVGQSRQRAEDVLIDHEQRYWQRTARAQRLDLRSHTLERAVTAAVLSEAATEAEAMSVCGTVPGIRDLREDDRLAVSLWLQELYPAVTGYWGLLQPDRLAEYLVGRTARSAPSFLDEFLPAVPAVCLERAFTVLGRTWAHQAHVGQQVRDAIAKHPAELAVAAAYASGTVQDPRPLADALSSVLNTSSLPFNLVTQLFFAIPARTQMLALLGLRVTATLALELKKIADENSDAVLPQYARVLSRLCGRLWQLHDHGKAAISIGEAAVAMLRRIAEQDPDANMPILADALNTLALQLGENQRYEEAVAVSEESVTIFRRYTRLGSPQYGLAMSLNTYSHYLSLLGDNDRALVLSGEALALLHDLSHHDLEHLSLLAGCMGNRAGLLGALSRYDEALATVNEAITYQRRLARERPDPHGADLCIMLRNRSQWLASKENDKEALKCYADCLSLYKQLVVDYPETLRPAFIKLLCEAALTCAGLGGADLAVDASAAAIALCRRFSEREPDAYRARLQQASYTHTRCLRGAGKFTAARKAVDEAVSLGRELTVSERMEYLPDLAETLVEAVTVYRDLGRSNESLAAAQEAVTCYRELSDADPDRFLDPLARTLNQLANRLADLGRRESALPSLEEAVRIRRDLAVKTPEQYESGLAASLNDLAGALANLGRYPEALAAADEAVAIRRRLRASRTAPSDPSSSLGFLLGTRGVVLAQMNRKGEALESINEGITVHGSPTDIETRSRFAPLLYNKAAILESSGSAQAALVAIDKALREQHPLRALRTRPFMLQHQQFLELRTRILHTLNRSAEAAATEARARATGAQAGLRTGRTYPAIYDTPTLLNLPADLKVAATQGNMEVGTGDNRKSTKKKKRPKSKAQRGRRK